MATPPWSREERDAAIRRGPHKSAHAEREFLLEEILDFYDQGYWAVLLYDDVRESLDLRISPLGVVPQHERQPQLVVDYSFSGMNSDTAPLAQKESIQFG